MVKKHGLLLFSLTAALLVTLIIPLGAAYGDFMQYWAAAVLVLQGKNPYDVQARGAVLEQLFPGKEPPPLYATPPVLIFYLWFGWLPCFWAVFVWRLASAYGISWCVYQSLAAAQLLDLGRSQEAQPKLSFFSSLLSVVVLISFMPAWQTLMLGQLSMPSLLGLAGYLTYRKTRPALAGICLSLTLLRFQVFLPFYAAVLLGRTSLRLMGWFGAGMVLLWALPLWVAPELYALYAESARTAVLDWRTPTLGALAHQYIDPAQPLWRFLPQMVAITFMVGFRLRHVTLSMGRQVLPLSLLTAPYAWSYDFIYLLPTVVLFLKNQRAFYLLGLNILLSFTLSPNHLSIWYPAALALLAGSGGQESLNHAQKDNTPSESAR